MPTGALMVAVGSGGEERRVNPNPLGQTGEEGGLETSTLVPGRLGGTDIRDRSRREGSAGGMHGKGAGGVAHGQRQPQLVSMHSINPAATAAAVAATAAAAGDGGGGVGGQTLKKKKKKKAKPKKNVAKKNVVCATDKSKRKVAPPGMNNGGNNDGGNQYHEEPASLSSSSLATATATSPAEAKLAVLGDPSVARAAMVVPAVTPVSCDRETDAAPAAAGHGGGFSGTVMTDVVGCSSAKRTALGGSPDGGGGGGGTTT
ncbi:unnamed protein product, partial [Ectocarpus sp. 8 AP-2014]